MQPGPDRTVVITGAASGIGLALARRCAARGADVVLADLDGSALDAARTAIEGFGVGVLAVPTDVTDPTAVDELAARALHRFGSCDLLCANAGVPGHPARVWEVPLADWRWALEVNLLGAVAALRSFVPAMVERGHGHVVLTGSIASWSAGGAMAPYAASKHALLALGESLHRDLAGSGIGIGVTVLCPGATATRFTDDARWPDRLGERPRAAADTVSAATVAMLAAGSTDGLDPDDVAAAALEAVEQGRFVATTVPDWLAHAAARRAALVAGGTPDLDRRPPGAR